jgi:hypothetical protein
VYRYINIPHYIREKYEKGVIGAAHYADYIRVALLAKYGGIWLDASIWVARPISETYFTYPLWSIKFISQNRKGQNWKWHCAALGNSAEESVFFNFLKESFEYYWLKYNKDINYTFFDHLIQIAIDEFKIVKEEFEMLPYNNVHYGNLSDAMYAEVVAEDFMTVILDDTDFYKVCARNGYSKKTNEGRNTIYQHFMNIPKHSLERLEKNV